MQRSYEEVWASLKGSSALKRYIRAMYWEAFVCLLFICYPLDDLKHVVRSQPLIGISIEALRILCSQPAQPVAFGALPLHCGSSCRSSSLFGVSGLFSTR